MEKSNNVARYSKAAYNGIFAMAILTWVATAAASSYIDWKVKREHYKKSKAA